MPPNQIFDEPIDTKLFQWIVQMRCNPPTSDQHLYAQVQIYKHLAQFATWFAHLRSSPAGYDSDQVVVNSLAHFFRKYLRDPHFQFYSVGHIIRIVGKITTNERRKAYRWLRQDRRCPHDADGNLMPMDRLDFSTCTCQSNEDPVCLCEETDEIEYYYSILEREEHRQVFCLLIAQFSRTEIAVKLEVDLTTVRLWIDQMRGILAPHAPRTTHQAPSTKHQAPSTKLVNE